MILDSLLVNSLGSIISAGAAMLKQDNNKITYEALNDDAKKEEVKLALAKSQARVAQELAIAQRIESAEEVEIEEIYDNSGSGNIGLSSNGADSLSIGIQGNGRGISKRIYRFKGFNREKVEVFEQKLSELNK